MYSDTWHHIADMPAIRLRSRNSIDNTEARKGSTRGDGEGRSGSGAEGRRLDPERKGTGKRRLVWQQVANRARWRRTKKREGGERGRWCGVAAVPFRCAAGSSVVGVSDPFINISKRLNFAALRANKISSRWKMWTGEGGGGQERRYGPKPRPTNRLIAVSGHCNLSFSSLENEKGLQFPTVSFPLNERGWGRRILPFLVTIPNSVRTSVIY